MGSLKILAAVAAVVLMLKTPALPQPPAEMPSATASADRDEAQIDRDESPSSSTTFANRMVLVRL